MLSDGIPIELYCMAWNGVRLNVTHTQTRIHIHTHTHTRAQAFTIHSVTRHPPHSTLNLCVYKSKALFTLYLSTSMLPHAIFMLPKWISITINIYGRWLFLPNSDTLRCSADSDWYKYIAYTIWMVSQTNDFWLFDVLAHCCTAVLANRSNWLPIRSAIRITRPYIVILCCSLSIFVHSATSSISIRSQHGKLIFLLKHYNNLAITLWNNRNHNNQSIKIFKER